MNTLFRALAMACLLAGNALPASANLLVMPGEVIQGHAKEEEFCEKCHKKFDKAAQSRLCADCHKEVGKDLAEKRGYHGRFDESKECKECHPDHKGRNAKIAEFDKAKFDHGKTDFTLKGGHLKEKIKCEDCHKAGKKYREASSYCNDCHKKDDKHKGGLGTDCAKCHVEKEWKAVTFDHDKTKFKLTGKHVDVKCDKCHVDNKFKDTPLDCKSCHKKEDDKAHKGKLGPKCETCHTAKGWKELLFDHDKNTKYPLLGKHKDVKCDKCHLDKKYKETPKVCSECHKKEDEKAHKNKFGTKCETCHTEKDWKETTFDHDKKTKFPLLGKHQKAKCDTCHKGDLYKDKIKETTCISCHSKEDDKVHKGKFGNKCESCHVEREWKEILFDHDKKTKYPLLGKHKQAKCSACHKGDIYKDKIKETRCVSCHDKDDKHKGQEGEKCESCHTEESWNKTSFNHNKMSKFPLLGRHALVECKKCHESVKFKDAKSDCGSCHEKDDVHKQKLSTECQTCHNPRNWKAWDFDHNKTNFKLDGPHQKTANNCYGCHKLPMGKKVVLTTACGFCHDKDDVHNGSFGDRCERCHEGNDWKQLKLGVVRSKKK